MSVMMVDQRRLKPDDPDFQRVHGALVDDLRRSVQKYVRDLRTGEQQAQTRFIQRHAQLLIRGLWVAMREGIRDYCAEVSQHPHLMASRVLADPATRDRLDGLVRSLTPFYAPSIARMAAEAMAAWQADPAAWTFAEGDGGDGGEPLGRWQGSLEPRLVLQANVTWAGFQGGYVESGVYDRAKPFIKLCWNLEPLAIHCPDCPDLAARSPYDPPSGDYGTNILKQTPGDGQTACGANCKCALEYCGSDGSETALWASGWPQNLPPGLGPGRAIQPPEGRVVTSNQMAALDTWRLAQRYWDQQRAGTDLPELPPMFDPTSDLALLDWVDLTLEQQKALRWALLAQQRWVEAGL